MMLLPSPITLTWNEALSGVFGSISLAAWIFLLLPQLIENYNSSSADGISLTFLLIWFIGDITNLAGALWAGLVPTVTALAVYFCFADCVLILQVRYYHALNARKKREEEQDIREFVARPTYLPQANFNVYHPQARGETAVYNDNRLGYSHTSSQLHETVPLLADPEHGTKKRLSISDVNFGDVTDDNMGLPGSRRRSSANRPNHTNSSSRRPSSLERLVEEANKTRPWIKNTISVFLVILAGTAGWAVAWGTGTWRPSPVGNEDSEQNTPIGAEILGYLSAICYLGARIPQIIKNQRERSCDGLSLLFFLLSLLGNATYGAGVS